MIAPPELLNAKHELAHFNCGENALDDWLKKRALASHAGGGARTYVIQEHQRVLGYHCLASGSVASNETPSAKLRRNMPDPIPMIVLGRLAVDGPYQKKGLGALLLRDAIFRAITAAKIIGIKGMFVHALTQEAKNFYQKWGFQESPSNPMLLMISLKELEDAMRP